MDVNPYESPRSDGTNLPVGAIGARTFSWRRVLLLYALLNIALAVLAVGHGILVFVIYR
jgi:hypothetical protein